VRDGPFIPHLKFLHQHPNMMATVTADKGAIKHVLAGSDIMDPGLTSAGGKLPDDEHSLAAGTAVCIMAEGKECAMAVGTLLKSTAGLGVTLSLFVVGLIVLRLDIRRLNEGKGVTNLHCIGDGLYAYEKTT
jgi:PUA domain protein